MAEQNEQSGWLDGLKGLFVETVGEKGESSPSGDAQAVAESTVKSAVPPPASGAPNADDERMSAELLRNVLASKTSFNALVTALETLQQVPDMNERTRYQAAFAMLKASQPCSTQSIVESFDVHAANLAAERRKFEEVSSEQATAMVGEKTKQIADWKAKAAQAQQRAEALRSEISALLKQENEARAKVGALETAIAADKRQIELIKQRFERALNQVQQQLQTHRDKVRQYLN
jgi:DNA repair exonuclease SbcCD ATPase subunit